MKQIKFLLSLAVALLIVVPVLAQDAAWGVSGDAKAVLNYSVDDSKADDSDKTSTFSVDDLVINVNFNATGEISPYIKMQYDKGDENRFWIGGTFKKGNFAGEANVKFDENTSDTTFVTDSKLGGGATVSTTVPGSSKQIDVDTAWVTYTMGAVEFKFDKGGVWSCDNTFKVTYTASDMLKVYLGISQTDIQNFTEDQIAVMYASPLYNAGVNITAGMLSAAIDASYAGVMVKDYKQTEGEVVAQFGNKDMAGQGFMFFEANASVTAAIAEGMSVKVYGGYGLNLDTFGNDSGYTDDDKPNEAACKNDDSDGFENAVSMKFGVEAVAMGAKITFDYKSVENGNVNLDKLTNGYEKAGDSDWKVAVSYDAKIGELTLTPGVAYKDNMKNKNDIDEGTELDVTLTAAVAF
ncbi:MAG: hypothetical protein JW982_00305 [Spirochaetes bacterium]|nr:hypothetical protein [Spirochaetota bacterium]